MLLLQKTAGPPTKPSSDTDPDARNDFRTETETLH